MDMINGVSECWWLSRTCRIDWSAWSAIGSAAAVFVALIVGVLPVASHYINGRARARVKAKVFLAQLDLAEFWIAVGYQLALSRPHEPNRYNAAIGFALNCRRVDTSVVLPEIEFMPRSIAELIGSFSVKCIEFERTVCGVNGEALRAPDDFHVTPTGHNEIDHLFKVSRALQEQMHLWLFPDLPPPNRDAVAGVVQRAINEIERI